MARTKVRRTPRRGSHVPGIAWRDPLARETDAIVAGWREMSVALPAGERHLKALLDAALAAYGARPHAGESVCREPGASRLGTWLARLDDLWERATEFLDTYGFTEEVQTPWVALHHAYSFDARAPHDTAHCGLCLAKTAGAQRRADDPIVSERVRFGPLPREVVPFCLVERIELLSTYSHPPDRPPAEFAPSVRSVAGGGLDRHELVFAAAVTGALEHVGLLGVLAENKVPFTVSGEVSEGAEPAGDGEPLAGAGAPVGEAGRVREALRSQLRAEVYRWVVRTGREPAQDAWSALADWPSGELVKAAYGSFGELIEDCELERSELLRRTRRLEREHERARRLSEDAQRRLDAAAAREREVSGTYAEIQELERAAGQTQALSAELDALRQRHEQTRADHARLQARLIETERQREKERAGRERSAAPGSGPGARAWTPGIQPGLPLYRVWMAFDGAVSAEGLLDMAAAWIDPVAAAALLATSAGAAEVELASGETVRAGRVADGDDWLWQARWRRACDAERHGSFQARAVVCRCANERHVGLEIGLVRCGAPLAPMASLGFRAPDLPARLLDAHPVSDAGRALHAHALELRDSGDAEGLAEFLYREERRRPVVHCSARRHGPSMDADRLARELAGLAHVTYATAGGVDDVLKAQLPGRLGAWGGAVRVYYPGLAKDVEHRYLSAEEIARHGEGAIRGRLLRDLGQLACATMGEPEAVVRIRDRALATCTSHTTADGQPGSPLPAGRDAAPTLGELLDEHERTLRELEQAREESTRLQHELEAGQRLSARQARQIAELSHRLAPEQNAAAKATSNRAPHDPPERDETRPRTALQAVTLAMRNAKHLVYAPGAIESAKDCPYHRPEHILDALRRLDQLAHDYLQADGIGCGLDERARQLGLRWQGGLQDALVRRYPNHYTIAYQHRRWTLGPHIALGGGDGGERVARIYLVAHPGDREIHRALIVGHVGRHLPDSTTG